MKHTKEEICNALQVIKDVCSENKVCNTCPFRTVFHDKNCRFLVTPPDLLTINYPEPEEVWKAFK
jgi:hypothetical protein